MSICKDEVFEKVFMEHSEGLRNFMYYKCGNLNQAEDLVQESFVKLWSNCAKVAIGKAKSYVFTIANNLFLNEVKHQKVVLKFQQQQNESSSKETPEFLLEEQEFKQQLEKAIADLPEGQREVFLLNRIDKKTYREIAEMLGVSVKAIEKRMHKALKALRVLTKRI
ncbi:MAG: RNA polymerase sigma-70 factor (family 1) [Maribacter sp.]|jgi:RNA polymerase sigma-70 factor (family 1)